MSGRLITINTDGTKHQVLVTSKRPTYEQFKTAVGGYIELIPDGGIRYEGRKREAYCNETGLIDGLPLNPEATKLWKATYPANAMFRYEPALHGPVAIWIPDPKKAKEAA